MPRKSAAALSIVPPATPDPPGIDPPVGLIEPVRARFLEIVNAVHPDHFTSADIPLITEYATACNLARQAALALQREPVVNGRPSAWLVIQEKSLRTIAVLAMRLRLCPQGRMSAAQARNASSRLRAYMPFGGKQ